MEKQRDSFKSRWGFILAGVGSAVGCGNIWRFPIMVSKYGGLTYILPYLLFVLLVAHSGIMEEYALGRFNKSGPIEACGNCFEHANKPKTIGRGLGTIPIFGSLGLAIGYTCVFGWIVKYAYMYLTGSIMSLGQDIDALSVAFGVDTASAFSNNFWIVIAALLTFLVLFLGVSNGIEKVNKVLMPTLYVLLIFLAIYVFTLDGSSEGYKYIFTLNPSGLLNPEVWIYAFGMAFFSLSVAGNASVIYGSYLNNNEDIPSSARWVSVFDTSASMLATLVILPAMAAGGVAPSSSGPGLIFIYLVNVFNGMKGGRIIGLAFFVLFVFAALSSIISMYEPIIAYIEERYHTKRALTTFNVIVVGLVCAILIQGIASEWMDVVNNYICPIGALVTALCFYWIAGKDYALNAINMGAKKKRGNAFYFLGKYVYCIATIVALVAGVLLGGIG